MRRPKKERVPSAARSLRRWRPERCWRAKFRSRRGAHPEIKPPHCLKRGWGRHRGIRASCAATNALPAQAWRASPVDSSRNVQPTQPAGNSAATTWMGYSFVPGGHEPHRFVGTIEVCSDNVVHRIRQRALHASSCHTTPARLLSETEARVLALVTRKRAEGGAHPVRAQVPPRGPATSDPSGCTMKLALFLFLHGRKKPASGERHRRIARTPPTPPPPTRSLSRTRQRDPSEPRPENSSVGSALQATPQVSSRGESSVGGP